MIEGLPPRPPPADMAAIPPSVAEYIARLEHLVELLARRVAALEEQVRADKRQATPFRREHRKPDRRKPGRKPGHEADLREAPEEIDDELDAPLPPSCPYCGGHVHGDGCFEQTQEDIVVRVVRRRIVIHYGHCVECRMPIQGRHPQQTSDARGAATHQIGPFALAIGTALNIEQGVPFDKAREHIARLGLDLSTACLVRTTGRLAARGEPAFRALLADVVAQDVLHIDETGWSVAGEPAWLWVLTGARGTVYFVRRSRSSNEVADFLRDFHGVLVSDGHGAYDKLGKTLTRALCLLHLRHNVEDLEVEQTGGAVQIPRALEDWIDRVIAFAPFRDQLSPEGLAKETQLLHAELDAILARKPTDSANRRLLDRITRLYADVTRCLDDVRVPATNNFGERQIRPGVIRRKRGGCSRSAHGAHTFEVLASLAASARQRGVDFVQWLVQLLCHPGPEPLLLPKHPEPG
jgi:transposase